jgi:hypothetical protein
MSVNDEFGLKKSTVTRRASPLARPTQSPRPRLANWSASRSGVRGTRGFSSTVGLPFR